MQLSKNKKEILDDKLQRNFNKQADLCAREFTFNFTGSGVQDPSGPIF